MLHCSIRYPVDLLIQPMGADHGFGTHQEANKHRNPPATPQ
jgi:hypothetical protein